MLTSILQPTHLTVVLAVVLLVLGPKRSARSRSRPEAPSETRR
jgi:hypothetical protein